MSENNKSCRSMEGEIKKMDEVATNVGNLAKPADAVQECTEESFEMAKCPPHVLKLQEVGDYVKGLNEMCKNSNLTEKGEKLLKEINEDFARITAMTNRVSELDVQLERYGSNYGTFKTDSNTSGTQLSETEDGPEEEDIVSDDALNLQTDEHYEGNGLKGKLEDAQRKMMDQQQVLIEKKAELAKIQEKVESLSAKFPKFRDFNFEYNSKFSVPKEVQARELAELFLAAEEENKLIEEVVELSQNIMELEKEIKRLNGEEIEEENNLVKEDVKVEAAVKQQENIIDYLEQKIQELFQNQQPESPQHKEYEEITDREKNEVPQNEEESSVQEEAERENQETKDRKELVEHGSNSWTELAMKQESKYLPEEKDSRTTSGQPCLHRFELTAEESTANPPTIKCTFCNEPILFKSFNLQCKICANFAHPGCQNGAQPASDAAELHFYNKIGPDGITMADKPQESEKDS